MTNGRLPVRKEFEIVADTITAYLRFIGTFHSLAYSFFNCE